MSIDEKDTLYNKYLSGLALYGDNLSTDDIRAWYAVEESGYYDLVTNIFFKDAEYTYEYAALNEYHGYRHIRGRHFRRALALGCARGDDVAPFADNVDEFLAIEPVEKWWAPSIGGKRAKFVKPSLAGDIPCGEGKIDLVVCLGILHHIPNVTHVISEIARVSATGAYFLMREPISTMGDWRKPRAGLTKNERGFHLMWFEETLLRAGFRIERRAFCMFPTTVRLGKLFNTNAYAHRTFVIQDHLVSSIMSWNYHYHRDNLFKKLAPGSVFYVLRKIGECRV